MKTSLETFYEAHIHFCKATRLEYITNKFILGKMITRMYDQKDFQQSKGQENKQQYMYVSLHLKDTATRMAEKQWNVICRPTWMAGLNNDQFVIRVPTVFNIDDEDFEVIFGVDMNTNRVRLIVDVPRSRSPGNYACG